MFRRFMMAWAFFLVIAFLAITTPRSQSPAPAQPVLSNPQQQVQAQEQRRQRIAGAFSYDDVPAIVAAYKENELRFKREYVGRRFSDKLTLDRISAGMGIFSDTQTRVSFGNVYCNVVTGTVAGITNWRQGEQVEISGVVKDVWFSTVELQHCAFRHS
jgi:hypothetical protein